MINFTQTVCQFDAVILKLFEDAENIIMRIVSHKKHMVKEK